jgi:hypothetical protein
MEKAGSLFGVGLPLVYSVVYFSITIYTLSKDLLHLEVEFTYSSNKFSKNRMIEQEI